MAYSGTQYSDISPRVGAFIVANFLATADPELVLEKFIDSVPVPKNKGLQIKFRRSIPYIVTDTALVEGVTPAPQGHEVEDIVANLQQYGAWHAFTDVLTDTHEDPLVQEMSRESGKQAALTKELLIWKVMRAGTAVIYTGGATSRATVEVPLTEEALEAAARTLKNNHAKKLTKRLSAGPNIATQPIRAAYVAFGHTNMQQDIEALTGYVPIENYANGREISEYEIGSRGDVRFILTPHLVPYYGAGSTNIAGVLNDGVRVDVYPLVILGEGAMAATPLKGQDSVSVAVKNPVMGASYEDPLGQRGFVAWKFWYAVVRLNEEYMIRIEAAVSML